MIDVVIDVVIDLGEREILVIVCAMGTTETKVLQATVSHTRAGKILEGGSGPWLSDDVAEEVGLTKWYGRLGDDGSKHRRRCSRVDKCGRKVQAGEVTLSQR